MISYSFRDKQKAEQLKKFLSDKGHKVSMMEKQKEIPKIKDKFILETKPSKMTKGIETCTFIACISESYNIDDFCRNEIGVALDLERTILFAFIDPNYVAQGWIDHIIGSDSYNCPWKDDNLITEEAEKIHNIISNSNQGLSG